MTDRRNFIGLYDADADHSACGVGFLTRKDSVQSNDVLVKAHQALCSIPHRGGMSSEGVGDGAGVSIDLSEKFFRKIAGEPEMCLGDFGVGNFFMPDDRTMHEEAAALIDEALARQNIEVITIRDLPVNMAALRPAARHHQLNIRQWIFRCPDAAKDEDGHAFDTLIYQALLEIEQVAYTDTRFAGLYPLSMSARTQVLKGRFNSHEIIPYFDDLADSDHEINTIFFHTRFSTNTAPHPIMAQPFRLMAHNGELNTDKKNRLSEDAIARMKGRRIISPKGQSDSARLDQTLYRRTIEDGLDLVTAVVAMMPPAWENDSRYSPEVRAMLEYFSLYEEKNDGPAALIFGNGKVVGARLDRLGLRPLRSVETEEYLCVTSEAGQIDFPPKDVIRRGRIESGGMLWYSHGEKKAYNSLETLEMLASRENYAELLGKSRTNLIDLPPAPDEAYTDDPDFTIAQRFVSCALNQESFKFMLDPMLQSGSEKVSAMGYGAAINALSDQEGGVAKYISQRFAQVTNPPLDSMREADGMTLRVALGPKPSFNVFDTKQIVVETPILKAGDLAKIRMQKDVKVEEIETCYEPVYGDTTKNAAAILEAMERVFDQVEEKVRAGAGIIVLSDLGMNASKAPLPGLLAVAGANQRLIQKGLRFSASIVLESGQFASSHHVAVALGFGASAICPVSVFWRAQQKFPDDVEGAINRFVKAANKALMKTMGKVGLCTAESYIGGEFFEPNFLDTSDPVLKEFFPNMVSPVGGVGFETIVRSSADWHERARRVRNEDEIPLLGLFKERAEGAGHSYGTTAVRGFVEMTEEEIAIPAIREPKDGELEPANDEDADSMRLLTLQGLNDSFGMDADTYKFAGFGRRTPEEIDSQEITPRYREFIRILTEERNKRPAALRDVLGFPADMRFCTTEEEFEDELSKHDVYGNESFLVRGLDCRPENDGIFELKLTGQLATDYARLTVLAHAIRNRFGDDIVYAKHVDDYVELQAEGAALYYFTHLYSAPGTVPLDEVQPASEITKTLASGAMSHGALVATAHEAVAHGTNIAGGLSNSGEGGEHFSRYGTIRASAIKQLASGRFGVWAGYLADPNLKELEIKIAQGAKPGEGGQLPAQKVTVEIAAARGGTPGVELVSPPPHHDTYSIEDLAQLIHDAKAARVRVIVKLVSSEGIGTIAVGVAKAGADVINVAGNTGGTGAAAVTSLKNTGRAAEIGIAEVHQALCVNGIRQKVILRASGAHQTGSDVVKSSLLGADSFEFGTTALMMLKCVMAKNCNVKCPAGLTTNPEVFDGDPRALAQYLINIAHEVREHLGRLGLRSLRESRGRSDLLHLLDHPSTVGQLDLKAMLHPVEEVRVEKPVYLEANFDVDDMMIERIEQALFKDGEEHITLKGPEFVLSNPNKTVGGQMSIDLERILQHQMDQETADRLLAVKTDDRGRRFLEPDTIRIETTGSAGQSYGAFVNDGVLMIHTGTANDGVGKGLSGGTLAMSSPGGGNWEEQGGNVLIGNFALFGATGGKLFVNGEAGDRFAVRNSGAVAVVEGVGDFACEYMTNGAVINLSHFGKGMCNGMSGGFAFQYDPEGLLEHSYSADSVLLLNLGDATEEAAIMRESVVMLLEEHVKLTNSSRAKRILKNWDTEARNFRYLLPRALAGSQNTYDILRHHSRKQMIEEMATALCKYQLRKFKIAWRDGQNVMSGFTPAFGSAEANETYVLLNSYTVMHMATRLAMTRLPGQPAPQDPEVQKAMKKLILTEDFALMQQLMKYARSALGNYSDEQLGVLVSDKRLKDYKEALSRRNVLSMYAHGTYGWIMLKDRENRERLSPLPGFEELFAREASVDIARAAS
ncbi:glutamate synthase large subunit [Parvularcula flava]|uniref:Glutamate synthase n=1 Tax=Aquisalinus luteolus TaxID=1566827 RepID=A0A8J3ETD8_9PROT|nr:glutamate synthase-related protein [Aquisalinus luteolus]NHK26847.1 glutamate synthase large subunit [Aquisalinus luteolus]GGH93592.1 glutamate synthase [Aquisalinus luteolus]